jgi:hypothetical protein
MDLEPWDFIDLSSFDYATVADARAWMTQTGSDVTFDHYGTEILFLDATLSEITDDMILV